MSDQIKLPKEAQEIIKHYGNAKPYDYHQAMEVLVNMVTELTPYLEDAFLPDFLSPRHVLCPPDVVEFLGSQRNKSLPSSGGGS